MWIGVTTARIRQRLTEGTLWAFTSGLGRLLPPAQFTATGAVAHLDKVVPLPLAHPALAGPIDTAAHQLGYAIA